MNKTTVLDSMECVDGWLTRKEGELLLDSCLEAIERTSAKAVVEIGSYKGRSTVVLGAVAKEKGATVFAVDPHEGHLTSKKVPMPPTFDIFMGTIKKAGLEQVVVPIKAKSQDALWDKPISFLFIDGYHTYEVVSSDHLKFSPWVETGGLVAFHDYGSTYPGVTKVANQAISSGGFTRRLRVGNLLVMQKLKGIGSL